MAFITPSHTPRSISYSWPRSTAETYPAGAGLRCHSTAERSRMQRHLGNEAGRAAMMQLQRTIA